MVYLKNIVEGTFAKIAAKLESMGPCSSVKDRYNLFSRSTTRHKNGFCVMGIGLKA